MIFVLLVGTILRAASFVPVPSRDAALNQIFELSSLLKSDDLTSDQAALIEALVRKRADARKNGNYQAADIVRDNIEGLASGLLPPGFKIELKDISRKDGGGSSWAIVSDFNDPIDQVSSKYIDGESVLQLSHAALGLATLSAERGISLDLKKLDEIVLQALDRLNHTGPVELRGRKAADAAFWFALSGVSRRTSPNASKLMTSLATITIDELQRFGFKSSCRAKDVMHIVERHCAAGINGDLLDQLSDVAADCLEAKEFKGRNTSTEMGVVDMLRSHSFDVHSDRSLLWIWRFSIRQRKQRSFMRNAAERFSARISQNTQASDNICDAGHAQVRWEDLFHDPSLPLTLDIGCGMGVSLHGLATLEKEQRTKMQDGNNFLGVDLSSLAVGYANGIASQWGIDGRLQYLVDSAEDVLGKLKTYPGRVQLLMIQFPTPFKFQVGTDDDAAVACSETTINGNRQLPKHPHAGFMVTKELLMGCHQVLRSNTGSQLMVQSNVEDVAVYILRLANEVGLSPIPASKPMTPSFTKRYRLPQRTAEYIATGGERAFGGCWSANSLLPRRGATETEIACFLERTPVHRCLLEAS